MGNGKDTEIKFEDIKFKYEIHIGVTEEGQVAVKDNFRSLITAFGMLDVAKDIIRTKMAKIHQTNVVKPGGIMNFAKSLRR